MTPEKEAIATFLNYYLSLGSIVAGLFSVVWIILLITSYKTKKDNALLSVISSHALSLGFYVTFVGMIMTLIYSDYLGILPCGLCWFQRIFLYSQVFLFGLAWYKNDRKIFGYTLILSIVGFIIATYHSYLQMGYSELLPCPVVASTIDCAKPTFLEFGFVTFPLMSAILFMLLILLSVTVKKSKK